MSIMDMKEIKISIPNGYEIDEEKSTFECIKLKKIKDDTEYVDLGLPSGTLWATCNVGASKPEEFGDYFTFYETTKYNCPTKEQFEELKDECNLVWVKLNDVSGYLIIGKNGNHIFLPAGGSHSKGTNGDIDNYGYYWSSSTNTDCPGFVWYLFFESNDIKYRYGYVQYYGFSVRQVKTR